jgi:hypothetical protein
MHVNFKAESPYKLISEIYLSRFPIKTLSALKNSVFWDVARVDLVWTDVSEERIVSIFRV